MYTPTMKSFWIDFPLNEEQYSKLNLKWRRRQNFYEIKNPPPDLRIRNFCTFGGDDIKIISLEVRGDVEEYFKTIKVMEKWITETLGEF
jgi:single-stranded DNA-specific DHH superfamily exonuclease